MSFDAITGQSIAELLVPTNVQASSRLGIEPDLSFHQGLVKQWNQSTGENVVEVGGTELPDLPALNISDLVIISPGDAVGILKYKSTMFILGRIVLPNSDQLGNAAIAFASNSASAFNFAMTTTETTKASITLVAPTWADEALVSANVHLTAQNTTAGIDFAYISPHINSVGGHQIFTQNGAGDWQEVSSSWQRVITPPFPTLPDGVPGITVECKANSLVANWTAQPENTALVTAQAVFRRVS